MQIEVSSPLSPRPIGPAPKEPTMSIAPQRRTQQAIALASMPLAVLFVAGLAGEVAIAHAMSGHALWGGGLAAVLALVYLVWFWLTTSHAVGIASGWFVHCRVRCGSASRFVAISISLLITAAFLVGYVISWGVYLQTGRFANWEAIHFALFNWHMLYEYILAADASQLSWAAGLGGASLIAIPFYGRWLARATANDRPRNIRPLLVWLGLTLLMLTLKQVLVRDISLQRRVARLDRLSACLNPAAALWASGIEAWYAEPIEACLDRDHLVPLRKPHTLSDAPQRRRSVVVVAIESLRHDTIGLRHQQREILPHINRLADEGHVWTRAYAQSTHSDYADVCLVSSLYPLRSRGHHFYHRDDPWPRTLLHDVLHQHGYATAIISSQNEAWGAMDQFLETQGLDLFYHPQTSAAPSLVSQRDPGFLREQMAGNLVAGKFPDRHTTDVALEWIRRQVAAGRPFYVSMNLQSSHFPYLIPDDSARPFQPCELDADIKFSSYPPEKAPLVRNAYYNAIRECDRQVGRLVEQLRQLGVWNETVLLVTGENGESFHENGCVGHACDAKEPVIHVAAVLNAPGLIDACQDDYPFEHVDVAPTILGLLGVPSHPNFQGSDALAAERTPARERLLFFHVISPIAKGDAVSLAGRWKYLTSQDQPQGVLFDLRSDPIEAEDVSESQPLITTVLRAALDKWRRQQLAYYHFPMYYARYYPPQPPKLGDVCAELGISLKEVLAAAER